MTLQDLGSIGEFVAAIATLATLVYLALQIRQNTRAVLTNTQQSLMDAASTIQASITEHPDVPALLIKANDDPNNLTPEESLRFEFFATGIFGQYENAFFYYRQRLMEPELWQPWDAGLSQFVQTPGFRKFWAEHKHWHHQSFQDHVDTRVFGPAD